MEMNTFVIFIFTVLILLIIGGVFLFFHLRHMREDVVEEWMVVLGKLRLRLDKIPNLVETVRQHAGGSGDAGGGSGDEENLLGRLISLREACWPIDKSDKNKISTEMEISDNINSVWRLIKKYPELQKDTNFLALKMEFREISKEIEESLEKYNGKVRSYNGNILLLLAFPLVRFFGFNKLYIFEFES